jgi:Ca-activated chloride channel family protein
VDTALDAIAQETDGAVLKLGLSTADLSTLYRTRIEPVARRKRQAGRFTELPERFPICLAAALGLAISGCWPGGRVGPWRWAWSRIAGAVLLGGLAVVGTGAVQSQNANTDRPAPDSSTAPVLVARGESAYASGEFASALKLFEAAIERAPAEPVPAYNAAAAWFQLGRYDEARKLYQTARERAGAALRTKIDYALGNSALLLGDVNGAVEHYNNCLASTSAGPGLDVVRSDAAENRRFALEQAPPSIAAQDDRDRDRADVAKRTRPPSARRRVRGDGDESTDDDRSQSEPQPGGAGAPDTEEDRTGKSQQRTGGGGGANPSAKGRPGESPDDRLDDALNQIRDAQHRRVPEDSPSDSAADGRKDW